MHMPIRGTEERLAAVRLARSERVGPVAFKSLISRFGSAAAALGELPGLSRRGGRQKALRIYSLQDAKDEFDLTEQLGAQILLLGDSDYPRLLSMIEDPPPVLTVQGNISMLSRPTIAIVGARNASINGRKIAERLAHDLGGSGFIVASGLAKGIDTAAHKGSLSTGTIAAMAGGIDVIYPPENFDLHTQIVEQGVAVSEQKPGTETLAKMFPRRNRIISGLSRGVIVVEATHRSGSLLTARIAGEQGRDVLAVPGSPLDPRSTGTNALLKDGAILVRAVDDVLNEISPLNDAQLQEPATPFGNKANGGSQNTQPAADSTRQAVIERLSVTPTTVDELLRDCQLPAPDVLMAILELEIAGAIIRHPGNQVSLG